MTMTTKTKKKALITAIAGQDVAKLLLAKDYGVHGIVRRTVIEDSEHKPKNIRRLLPRISLPVASLDNVFSPIKTIGERSFCGTS